MSQPPPTSDPRVINHPIELPRWDAWDERVQQLVLGPTPGDTDYNQKPRTLALVSLPADLAVRFPNLTHLYLWNLTDLKSLPPLPAGLRCLDLRGCVDLTELPALPATLETLVLDVAVNLERLAEPVASSLPKLTDLSLKGCAKVPEAWIHHALTAAPALRQLDASDCPQLEYIPEWPPALERIELNNCHALATLPGEWPECLYRLGAKDALALTKLGDFKSEAVIDHVNLAGTAALKSLPKFGAKPPRTLFLHGAGVDLDPALKGESTDTNVAEDVFADLGEAVHGSVLDHEVKIILLGNGRAGKTSLARRLAGKRFDHREHSTHGVRLWTLKLPFTPVDESDQKAEAALNIWDFGGQHLYENTHRLFLQNRAVFVICGTDAGKGADDAGDTEANGRHDQDQDIVQSYAYWQEQVEALGKDAKGECPPVIVLTTKADRPAMGQKWAQSIQSVPEENRLAISAKAPGQDLEKFKELLGKQVARLLGRRGERRLGRRPAAVKEELGALKAANEKAWSKAEARGRRTTPKHAKLALDEARAMIQHHCPDGAYHKHPELLLRRLHRAGFLYWNEAHLPQEVILDQRWAIDGIYAVLDRTSRGYVFLKESRGVFTPQELADWGWKEAGYSKDEQKLFLGFMESCGVAIQLLDSYETGNHPCFMAPGLLAPESRGGLAAPESPEVCETPLLNVESRVMIRLFQAVAHLQGREFERWQWGLKCSDDIAPRDRRLGETLWVQWTPTSPEGVTGDLKVCIKTPDPRRSLYAALVREALGQSEGRLFPHRGMWGPAKPWTQANREEWSLAGASLAEAEPFRPLRPLLRITMSFAGDPQRTPAMGTPGSTVPHWKHTAFSTALRVSLETPERRESGGYRVLDYQADEAKRIASLRELMKQLVKGDVLVIVLSRRYFESPYCMQELFEIAQKLEGKARGTPPEWTPEVWNAAETRTLLYWLPDATNAARDQAWKSGLKAVWEASSEAFVFKISKDHFNSIGKAAKAVERAAQGHAYFDGDQREPVPDLGACVGWFAASDTPQERQRVIDFLDSLIERKALAPALLNDAANLLAFAEKEADELVQKSRLVYEILPSADRSDRYEEEIGRALSASTSEGSGPVVELFHEWLDLNADFKKRFASEDAPPRGEVSQAIQSAWQLALEQVNQKPRN